MCCRTASTKPILPRKETKTAIPPNGVTARCVWRRINRSSDNRALISRGTGLSVAFDSIPLLSQIIGRNPTSNFGFPALEKKRSAEEAEARRVYLAQFPVLFNRSGQRRMAEETLVRLKEQAKH